MLSIGYFLFIWTLYFNQLQTVQYYRILNTIEKSAFKIACVFLNMLFKGQPYLDIRLYVYTIIHFFPSPIDKLFIYTTLRTIQLFISIRGTCTTNLNVHVSITIKTKYLLICFMNICGSYSMKHLFKAFNNFCWNLGFF